MIKMLLFYRYSRISRDRERETMPLANGILRNNLVLRISHRQKIDWFRLCTDSLTSLALMFSIQQRVPFVILSLLLPPEIRQYRPTWECKRDMRPIPMSDVIANVGN